MKQAKTFQATNLGLRAAPGSTRAYTYSKDYRNNETDDEYRARFKKALGLDKKQEAFKAAKKRKLDQEIQDLEAQLADKKKARSEE